MTSYPSRTTGAPGDIWKLRRLSEEVQSSTSPVGNGKRQRNMAPITTLFALHARRIHPSFSMFGIQWILKRLDLSLESQPGGVSTFGQCSVRETNKINFHLPLMLDGQNFVNFAFGEPLLKGLGDLRAK